MLGDHAKKSNPQSPIDLVVSRLHGVRAAGAGWAARCPAHEDSHASLAVGIGADDRVLMHCHVGCDIGAIVGSLGLTLADLFVSDRHGQRTSELRIAPPPATLATAAPAKAPRRTPAEWAAMSAEQQAFVAERPGVLAMLADELLLALWCLSALPIGGVRHGPHDGEGGQNSCWTTQEMDASERIIGLTCRYPGGSKASWPGGQRGLTLPAGWRERAVAAGVLYIVEGGSDALSLWACGLAVVGRPSNSGGADLLAALLRDLPDVRIVIMGERDKKPDGAWPGRIGMEAVGRQLADTWGRPVELAMPPAAAKDARAWLLGRCGGDARGETPEALAALGREWTAAVLAGAESATTTALPAVAAGLPTLDEAAEWAACRVLPLGAACGCRTCGTGSTRTGRVHIVRLRCRRWTGCERCRAINVLLWRRHARDLLGRLPRLWVWRGAWADSRAIIKAIRRARGRYICIAAPSGRCIVASVPIGGGQELTPGDAIRQTWEALGQVPAGCRRAVTSSRAWAMRRTRDVPRREGDVPLGTGIDLAAAARVADAAGARTTMLAPTPQDGWLEMMSAEMPPQYRTAQHMRHLAGWARAGEVPHGGDLDIPPPAWAQSSLPRYQYLGKDDCAHGPADLSKYDDWHQPGPIADDPFAG